MIVSYAVFDTSTGELIKSGVCPDNMVNDQATTGQTAVSAETRDGLAAAATAALPIAKVDEL